jgi:hypothetical protein
MIYYYTITDLKSGKTYKQSCDLDEFSCYRDFIGHLEAMNEFWSGLLKYEEGHRYDEDLEKKSKSLLTSEYDMV